MAELTILTLTAAEVEAIADSLRGELWVAQQAAAQARERGLETTEAEQVARGLMLARILAQLRA